MIIEIKKPVTKKKAAEALARAPRALWPIEACA